MSRLDIRLLGAPEIDLDGKPIQVDTRKAVALLAYLAVSEEHHRRDSLATFLWPESDQARARAALRRTLSSLSNALHGEWLAITRETVGMRDDCRYRLDVRDFRSALEGVLDDGPAPVDDITSAVGLYRGDFMAGFGLRDSPPFDDWQYLQAETARRDLARALERLTTCCTEAGDLSAAADYARRWLSIDRLQEAAHRQLMRIHALLGDRATAIRQYRECVQILDQELGVGPLEETTQLYQAIMESQLPMPQRSDYEPVLVPSLSASPLVGRSTERAELIRGYQSIGSGGRLIVIEGEAGIGKSRLAGELIDYARSEGAAILASACYAGESKIAYGVIAGLLRASLELPEIDRAVTSLAPYVRDELARILPEVVETAASMPLPLDSPGALDRFYDGIAQFLLALARAEAPTLLFIDDTQWIDEASLNLLSHFVRRLQRSPVCVLITWRSEDLQTAHTLRQLLGRTQRDGTASLIELEPLTQSAISELVGSVAPDGGPELGRRLFEESEGIPFFAVEYLAYAAGEKRQAGESSWPMPGSVRDLIHSRLQRIDDTGQQLLTTAAVIGRSFDFDLLRESSGRSETESVETLDHLLRYGLIRETSGAAQTKIIYDFSHEKVRVLLYEETSLARRRLVHRRVATALERRARRSPAGGLAGQIAHHYRLAGMEPEAARYHRLAGDHARALYGNGEALNHYKTALALGYPEPADLHAAIGDLETLGGSYADALRSYQTAAAHAGSDHLPLIEHQLGVVHQRLGDWDIAERHFERAFSTFDAERSAERARTLADWSLVAYQREDIGRAVAIGRRALALATASQDNTTLARVHNLLGILARSQGDAVGTARSLEQSLRYARAMDDPGARIAALNNLALVCADQREFERAISLTEEALALCRAQGDRHREAALLNNLADFCHMAADDERSMAYLKSAVAIFAEIGQRTDPVRPEIWKLVEW